MWSRLSTICMVALLLFFTLTYATARPEPTFSDATPIKINNQHVVHKFPNIIISKPTLTSSFLTNLLWVLLNFLFCFVLKDAELEKVMVEDLCEGVGKEECLERRTLAAHLDYIYTQKHKP